MGQNDLLRIDPEAEAVATGDCIVLRNGSFQILARGLRSDVLHAVTAAVERKPRTYDELVSLLTLTYPRSFVESLLHGLMGVVLTVADSPAPVPIARPSGVHNRRGQAEVILRPVIILGDGPLATRLEEALIGRGLPAVHRFPGTVFASCVDPRFLARRKRHVPLARAGVPPWRTVADPLTTAGLEELIADADLVLCALEWMPYRAQLDVADAAMRTGTPVLFVTAARGGAVVGPTYVPGVTACFECERLMALCADVGEGSIPPQLIDVLTCHGLSDDEHSYALGTRICAEVLREIETRRAGAPHGGLFTAVARLPVDGERQAVPLLPDARCSRCARPRETGPPARQSGLRHRALVDVVVAGDRVAASRPGGRPTQPEHGYRSVGVLGGGTAGYLAALTFRARHPEIAVTLIESSTVPVIGVGEATTPRLVEYLHSPADLGHDIVDFHRRVLPIWKLGVLYQWGRPGTYQFPWPFQYGRLLEPYLFEGDISRHCLGALLMAADRVPVFDNGDGSHTSLLDVIPFAYHIDNGRFVQYLREEAERAGVIRVDRVIADAVVDETGESLEALVADDGQRFEFDLYVDCSGFRSVLLEGKLGSPFVSYETSLFTDSAVVANVPHNGVVKPYTVAESMDNGWCWNIAFEDEDHRGYVFSSAFCDNEQAEAEMRAKNPGMGDAWTLRFRSGRHEQFWKGNVIAIGNAYAFVEPLASTAIHMLLFELDLVSSTLPAQHDVRLKEVLNRQANEMWDNLRGWLAVQYKFNRKYDTSFWRTCHAEVDLATAAAHVERFKAKAPLTSTVPQAHPAGGIILPRYANDYFAQEYVYDVMLFGQDVECQCAAPTETRAAWRMRTARAQELVRSALPQATALDHARKQPEILASLVSSPGSWLGEHLY